MRSKHKCEECVESDILAEFGNIMFCNKKDILVGKKSSVCPFFRPDKKKEKNIKRYADFE